MGKERVECGKERVECVEERVECGEKEMVECEERRECSGILYTVFRETSKSRLCDHKFQVISTVE